MIGPATFRFLNRAATLEWPADWNTREQEKLWLYNLHYFDDINAIDAPARTAWHRTLIARWIAENPPGESNGWEPYPLSLRLVNWIKWSLRGNALEPRWVDSLAMQARWLARRVEWHLLGNHLFANAKALVFAGAFFDGPEVRRWLDHGLAILDDEIREQVLADGGHFELSPMYHAIILEDLLDLINLSSAYPTVIPAAVTGAWRETAQRMRGWLSAMCHPDGEISFFNDAARGIASALAEIEAYAGRCGLAPLPASAEPVTHLAASGYARLQWDECTAFFDLAAVGPLYLPGHAHADTLSFEMSIGAERVVVNGGTSQYGTGPGRHAERSTAAHSTVEIDGQNSSEVWGGFRVARRARVFDVAIERHGSEVIIACSHDGYRRLPGRPAHQRQWFTGDHSLRIVDTITGEGRHRAVARFHLAPNIRISLAPDETARQGTITTAAGRRLDWRCSVPVRAEASAWHPEFGMTVPTAALVAETEGKAIETEFRW